MSLTDYGENWMLNAFKSGGTYYLGLFTSIPGEAGGGNEVSGGAAAFKHLFQFRFQNDKRSRSALTDTALLGKHIKCFCGMQCVKHQFILIFIFAK